MIALVLLLAPFVDAFWARDLGTLKRELVEHPSAERRLLFDDLLRLLDKLAHENTWKTTSVASAPTSAP